MIERPQPGRIPCLVPECGREFKSRDIRNNRICPVCTKKPGRDRQPRVFSVRLGGGVSPPE